MDSVGPAYYEMGDLVTQDLEKAEVKCLFASVFPGKTIPQESQVPETKQKGWSKKDAILVEQDQQVNTSSSFPLCIYVIYAFKNKVFF